MPNYDYECLDCGKRFELFQSMNDEKLKECQRTDCSGKGKVRRLLGTGGGVIFKGSGFYQTDYRSSSYEAGVKAENKKSEAPAAPKPASDKSAS